MVLQRSSYCLLLVGIVIGSQFSHPNGNRIGRLQFLKHMKPSVWNLLCYLCIFWEGGQISNALETEFDLRQFSKKTKTTDRRKKKEMHGYESFKEFYYQFNSKRFACCSTFSILCLVIEIWITLRDVFVSTRSAP